MCQFNFLIVEDDHPTLQQLTSLVREDFPDSMIDTAGTVAEGLQRLQSAGSEAPPYDAAILDFKLPPREGENPEVDTSLSLAAQRKGYPLLVAQITAFAQDPIVQEHVQKTQLDRPNPKTFNVSKRKTDWAVELVANLRRFLYSDRVRRELDEIFPDSFSAYAMGSRRRRARVGIPGGKTHRLAALCRMVEAHWEDLEEELKQRIRDILEVDESSAKPKVGLLLGDPWINLQKPSDDSPPNR